MLRDFSQSLTRTFALLLLAVAVVGMAALLYSTRWGAAVSDDSIDYVVAARTLLNQGQMLGLGEMRDAGKLVQSTHYGPLLSVILALLSGLFRTDPWYVAHGLNVLTFGLNTVSVGLLVYLSTNRSLWLALLVSILFVTSTNVIQLHAWVMSEPLFYLQTFISLVLLVVYVQQRKLPYLVYAALAASLACLTRYIGLTVILTGCIGLVLLGSSTLRGKIRDVGVFLALSSFLPGLWYVRNYFLTGAISNPYREFAFHLITRGRIIRGLTTVASWLYLDKLPFYIMAAAVVGIAIGIVVISIMVVRSNTRSDQDNEHSPGTPLVKLPYWLLIFITVYFLFLLFSISFYDYFTSLDQRILSPVYIALLILVIYLIHYLWRGSGSRLPARIILVCICLGYLGLHVWNGLSSISALSQSGQGLINAAWQQSSGIQRLNTIPPETPVFTNAPDAVLFLTGRVTTWLPLKTNYFTGQANKDYRNEIDQLKTQTINNKAVIVLFKAYPSRFTLLTLDEINNLVPLQQIADEPDASFYVFKGE